MKTSSYACDTKLPLYTDLGCNLFWVQWVVFPNDIHQCSITSHEGVVCETSTSEEDWRELKDYLAIAATSFDVKKVNQQVWFDVTLHLMGIKNSAKVCITKSTLVCNTKKEPSHVSMIALKRLVIP